LSLRVRRRAITAPALAGLLLAAALGAGCGDDDGGDADAPTTEITSSYEEIPMAEVLTRLPALLAAGDAAGAAAEQGDFDAVLAEYDELHDVWVVVEGTIKATDRELYSGIETAQSLIKDGGENEDADRVAAGVRDQADLVGIFVEGNQ